MSRAPPLEGLKTETGARPADILSRPSGLSEKIEAEAGKDLGRLDEGDVAGALENDLSRALDSGMNLLGMMGLDDEVVARSGHQGGHPDPVQAIERVPVEGSFELTDPALPGAGVFGQPLCLRFHLSCVRVVVAVRIKAEQAELGERFRVA